MQNELLAGTNWRDLFSSIPSYATAQALKLALTPILGSSPSLTSIHDYHVISFTPEQEDILTAWILTQLNREEGPVRIELGNIALRVVSRKYWPYAAGIALAGAAICYAVIKGKP